MKDRILTDIIAGRVIQELTMHWVYARMHGLPWGHNDYEAIRLDLLRALVAFGWRPTERVRSQIVRLKFSAHIDAGDFFSVLDTLIVPHTDEETIFDIEEDVEAE